MEEKDPKEALKKFWRKFFKKTKKPPFIAQEKDDEDKLKLLESKKYFESFESYLAKSFLEDSHYPHLYLLPNPYVGDLTNSKVFILMLNPGFSFLDYYAEKDEKYREAIIKIAKQEELDYPFIFLNPEFLWTGGGMYWVRKLKDILKELHGQKGGYRETLRFLSKKISVLELFPYHSQKRPPDDWIEEAKSAGLIKDFVEKVLVPKANKKEILLIVMRGAKLWGIDGSENILILGKKKAQAASFSEVKERIWSFLEQDLS